MIADTSLDSYLGLSEEKLRERDRRILELLRTTGPKNNREIAELLHLPVNVVTPRTLSLRNRGLLFYSGRYKDPVTHSWAYRWKAIPHPADSVPIPSPPPAKGTSLTLQRITIPLETPGRVSPGPQGRRPVGVGPTGAPVSREVDQI